MDVVRVPQPSFRTREMNESMVSGRFRFAVVMRAEHCGKESMVYSPLKKELEHGIATRNHTRINEINKDIPSIKVLENDKIYKITLKQIEIPAPYYVEHGKMILRPTNNRLWRIVSWCCLTFSAILSKLFLKFCSSTIIYSKEPFLEVLMDPKRIRPILTVSNHLSTIPLRNLLKLDLDRMRWTLGAQEICFTSPLLALFFTLGQVIPTVRGAGIYQPAMNFAIDRLNEGKWVHVFPEGKVNQTMDLLRFKWGVGRLMMESTNLPIVIPLWHKGLDKIMPETTEIKKKRWIPILGENVVIIYGSPIDFKDILIDYHEKKTEEVETRIIITETIFRAMDELQKKAEVLENNNKRPIN
ncbi:4999_t:CDS:2 [Diversispora eburnea]|uniref:Tafazzin family protein n=1 Tax=Diversispora eburnea TaxID=1213867 RepID=A0A9N9AKC2_9GLOM|nr:4999_t:CDS:2 [Diversispora eburnea]